MVLLDMVMAVDPKTPVFYLDTGLLFAETHRLVERVGRRYGIDPIGVRPTLSLDEQSTLYGDALWLRSPDTCCALRKVEALRTFLKSYDAWITGIRREQTPTRRDAPIVTFDEIFGVTKISPILDWTDSMVWTYVRAHNLDYNELHDDNYPSIGCVPCTRRINPDEAPRSGRWPGSPKTECGLHSHSEMSRH
jgi:phosphoadenosine phosphosulfate reductase